MRRETRRKTQHHLPLLFERKQYPLELSTLHFSRKTQTWAMVLYEGSFPPSPRLVKNRPAALRLVICRNRQPEVSMSFREQKHWK